MLFNMREPTSIKEAQLEYAGASEKVAYLTGSKQDTDK
jgi:hypothetical protein